MNAGWYHNGGNSTDDPKVEYVEAGDYAHAREMSDGPFDTFEEAKRELVKHHETMRRAHADAKKAARLRFWWLWRVTDGTRGWTRAWVF